MKKIACISDVHGCYHTLMALLMQIPSEYEIVFLGDLVDRGPRSKQVVDFVRKVAIAA